MTELNLGTLYEFNKDAMKNEIEQKIKQFYIDNPRKFKYSYSIQSEYSIYMKPFKEKKIFKYPTIY